VTWPHLSADQMADSTFVVAVISAVAAVLAAFFAWRGPTKSDLQRVERNTEQTARHVAEQNRREALSDKANVASLKVMGSGWSGQPLAMQFTLKDPTIRLLRIVPINRLDSPLGSFECEQTEPFIFSVTIDANTAGKWFNESAAHDTNESKLVQICAWLEIEKTAIPKPFTVRMTQNMQQTSPEIRSFAYFITVSGEC